MAEILGIVANFLGPAMEFGKCIYEPMKRQLNYLCCFNNNVQNMKDEAKKLEDARGGLQMRVDEDENNARVVIPQVKTWLGDASNAQAKMCEIETEIAASQNGSFSLKSRYSLGRKVKKTAEAMKELRESCDFNVTSHPPPPQAFAPIQLGSAFEFESRKKMEDEITTSLRDTEANKVGICGMGGIGKTTMAKRIMHRVRKEQLFEEIVMVVVSQNADMARIQDDIAISLGLKLGEGSLSYRAHLLRSRLSESTKKSLIVVDDVWENLTLEDLGIPCSSGCKVLLTTRDRNMLKKMNIDKIYALGVLSETEAWHLFRSNAGSCIDDQAVVSVAQQVVAKCTGLPIALVTVGAALKDTVEASIWEDVLQQLKSHNPTELPEVIEEVYNPLRLSYDLLKSEGAKSLFLMCCLYRDDDDIPLVDLAIYGMGLGIFGDIEKLEQARNRVCTLVELLKSRFLLLKGKNKDHVIMHDVVRDIAIFIASDKRLITRDSKRNDCSWISPYIGRTIGIHAGSTVFPNLHMLWMCRAEYESEMDNHFFQGMKELKVCSMRRLWWQQQLPKTTRLLKNLKTLVLEDCTRLKSISVVCELVNLEILICRGCLSIESLPIEMKRLRRLRLLLFSNCRGLKTIAVGMISNLKQLEELILEESFKGWEVKNMEEEPTNASLSELKQLSSLNRLKIGIKYFELEAEQIRPNTYLITIRGLGFYAKKLEIALPENISLGNWIHKYVGFIEHGDLSFDLGATHENIRELIFQHCYMGKKLVRFKTTATIFPLLEVLRLENHRKIKEIFEIDEPTTSDALNNLKELKLVELPALEHLWKTRIVSPYLLNKLSSLSVFHCHKLRCLFSSSMMTRSSSLPQLERLEIEFCDSMEYVFSWDEEEENQSPLVFPKLKSLTLKALPKLISFNKGVESIEFPVLEVMHVERCQMKSFVSTSSVGCVDDPIHLLCEHDKVKFDSLTKLSFIYQRIGMGRTCCPQIPLNFLFPKIRNLTVIGFNGLKSLFSFSTTESVCLPQLEMLEIWKCDMMEEVISWSKEENQTTVHITLFPKLKLLKLAYLPSLSGLSKRIDIDKEIKSIEFPVLEEIIVAGCPLQSYAFSLTSSIVGSPHILGKSRKVKFDCLSKLELCCSSGTRRSRFPQIPLDFFPRLRELKVRRIDSLKNLFPLSITERGCLPQLEILKINCCRMMEEVILWKEEENQIDIHTTLFPKLKVLKLVKLPKLTSVAKGILFLLPAEMKIRDCPLLGSCVSCFTTSLDASIHLFCEENKVDFGRLKELEICGDSITWRNWCPQIPMIDIFSGLSKLSVNMVAGVSLFSCSVARNLHNMRHLSLWDCEDMVRVIEEDEACGGETSPFHLFPNLEELHLRNLPKLKSFCEWRCALEFPSLTTLHIRGCDLIEEITSGPLNTPLLQQIWIEREAVPCVEDANNTLRRWRLEREASSEAQIPCCMTVLHIVLHYLGD